MGTSIKNINNGHIKDNFIVLPKDKTLIENFEKQVNPLFDKMGVCIKENQELAKLRDFIFPMLMNGQIKIKA